MVDLITLAQAGPAAILLVGIVLLFRAFQRGDIVPGWIYRATLERAEKADTQAERTAEALAALAKVAANGKPPNGKPVPSPSPDG